MKKVNNVSCMLCNNREALLVLKGRDIHYNFPGDFYVLKCSKCSFHFSYPDFTTDELIKFYPEEYYGDIPNVPCVSEKIKKKYQRLSKSITKKLNNKSSRSLLPLFIHPSALNYILPHQDNKQKLLDVGAGWGDFISQALAMGWECEALDFSPAVKRIGEKHGIVTYTGALEDMVDKLAPPYDLISFNNCVEHLSNPIKVLTLAKGLLNTNGILRIQIPMWNGLMTFLLNKYWFNLDLPRHRWHFRVKDIKRLCHTIGYKHVLFMPETSTHSLATSLRLLSKQLGLPLWTQKLFSVNNKFLRLVLYPLGWLFALVGKPFEATFYILK